MMSKARDSAELRQAAVCQFVRPTSRQAKKQWNEAGAASSLMPEHHFTNHTRDLAMDHSRHASASHGNVKKILQPPRKAKYNFFYSDGFLSRLSAEGWLEGALVTIPCERLEQQTVSEGL
jgi:hypothetical protein